MDNTQSPPILLKLCVHLSVPNSSIPAEHMNLHDAAADHSTQATTPLGGAQRPQDVPHK